MAVTLLKFSISECEKRFPASCRMVFVAGLRFTVQVRVIVPGQLPNVTHRITTPGRVEWPQHGAACQADSHFVVG